MLLSDFFAVAAVSSSEAFRLLPTLKFVSALSLRRVLEPDLKTVGAEIISKKPLKLLCVVEPSPFTYVSGYANRFQEMLKCFNKTGDEGDHRLHMR